MQHSKAFLKTLPELTRGVENHPKHLELKRTKVTSNLSDRGQNTRLHPEIVPSEYTRWRFSLTFPFPVHSRSISLLPCALDG